MPKHTPEERMQFGIDVESLKEAIVEAVDKYFGKPPNELSTSVKAMEKLRRRRDRAVVSALLDLAAKVATEDNSYLGAIQLFTNLVIEEVYGPEAAWPSAPGKN
jgi:hypothetical protein